jgi:hypothetical protein
MPEDHIAVAQKVLDQLWNERLIPFALTVARITKDYHEYTVYFHDSRMRTAEVSSTNGQLFAEGLRAVVLERVARLGGPWANWHPEKANAKISS